MTIEDILTKLETHDYAAFQREALQAAMLQQEAVTPALLDIVARIARQLALCCHGRLINVTDPALPLA